MQMTQPLKIAATTTPNTLATVFGEREQTWGQMQSRVAKLAGALHGLGVEREDRVAILANNSDRYLEYYFSVWWAGAAVMPLNVRWSPSENAYSLNDGGAKILFVDAYFTLDVAEICCKTGHDLTLIYIGDGDCPQGMLRYEDLIAEADPVEDSETGSDDLAGIFYTGGTTGFPKGAMLSHQCLWFNGIISAKHYYFEPGDRYLHAAPMFHLADGSGSNGASMAGATHCFLPSFSVENVIAEIETNRPTHVLLVPTMVGMILEDPGFDSAKFSSLKHIIYGASPMPEGVLRQTMAALPDVKILQGYGQTELGPIISTLPPQYHVLEGPYSGKLRSAGRPCVGVQVKIVGEDGIEMPQGDVGEIAVKGPHTMLGYWRNPEQTKATLKDGWVMTGDGAYLDADGFIFIVDRVKDMIVTGGENVFSAEVENVISTHPAVAAVAVIGIPNEKWGEAVHAIIIPKLGAAPTDAEIIDHCRSRIANYKRPHSIEFRSDPFPLSGAGKVMKRELRAPFWADQGQAVG